MLRAGACPLLASVIVFFSTAVGAVRGADEKLDKALAEYEKAKAEYEKTVAEVEKQHEKTKDKKSGQEDYQNALGKVIAEYLPYLQHAAWRIGASHRGAGEAAMRKYDMNAMRNQAQELRNKLCVCWNPKSTFCIPPMNLTWEKAEAGKVLEIEHTASNAKIDVKSFLTWLHLSHEFFGGGSYTDGSSCTIVRPEADSGKFNLYIVADQYVAFWFYLRAPTDQEAKLEIKLSKEEYLDDIYVNRRSAGKSEGKPLSVKLHRGVNLVVVFAKNIAPSAFSAEIKVMGQNLECGVEGK
ncbi:MAG: hypothetical protein N3A66_00020 [Planctomycetota bacterium]|nr:hypothetical protein [Planctomycetota bacterium]